MKRPAKTKRAPLEPCPFCGGSNNIDYAWTGVRHMVCCYSCGCEGPLANTAAGARKAWNRRAK